jgi:hypothetical protein
MSRPILPSFEGRLRTIERRIAIVWFVAWITLFLVGLLFIRVFLL